MTKIINPTLENQTTRIYEHGYLNYFVDKVMYLQAESNSTQLLLDQSLEQRSMGTNSYNQRLAGDLQEEYLLWSHQQPTRPQVAEAILNTLSGPSKQIIGQECTVQLIDVWVNFQKAKEHNPIHSHSGTFSFIWYLDIPEQIRQEHLNQTSSTHSRGMIEFIAERSNDTLRFNPISGDVFLFRADHSHQVYPFYTDCERISIAGNISVTF